MGSRNGLFHEADDKRIKEFGFLQASAVVLGLISIIVLVFRRIAGDSRMDSARRSFVGIVRIYKQRPAASCQQGSSNNIYIL